MGLLREEAADKMQARKSISRLVDMSKKQEAAVSENLVNYVTYL